ncbi:MAG: peptidylprolyl isomerase [Acidobacteria bacterium]|nr:peptidylprolyl isomerase [Acidobacteriota bacterium]
MRAGILVLLLSAAAAPAASAQPPVQSPYSAEEMRGKQAVVETTLGQFVIQLLPDVAPNHVGFFMKQARDGAYAKTLFHYVLKNAVIQGGDPNTKDPAKAADYGQGGFHQLAREENDQKHTSGAVSTVRDLSMPASGGAQFFVCVTDQPDFDGKYDVFGRVVEGMEVVQAISAAEASAAGLPKARVEITNITIRDTPPEPFVNDTPADLAGYKAVIETTMGHIELEMLPKVAPETVRQFLRLAQAKIFDGIKVHRIVPNFVIQTGALNFRATPLTGAQRRLVHPLKPEFNDTTHVPGVVSMAHGDDPASATTSFFICTGQCRGLDGKFTAFARVISGMDVVRTIATVSVEGETPRQDIVMKQVRVEKR